MLSHWCWKQQATKTTTLSPLEGSERGKGQWSRRMTSESNRAPRSRAFMWFLLHLSPTLGSRVRLRAHTDRQAFSPVCTAIDNLPQSFPSPWAEQRHCLSFPLSSFHLCFQKTKRTLHYALKQCNLLLPWSIRAQPQAVSRLQAISLCDYCFV